MINYLIKIFVFLIFFSTNAFSETLKEIKITGNKRISKDTILVLGDIKIGKKIDEIELNQTLKNLYQTNFFSDIKISLDNEILIVNLKENPIIEKIDISELKKSLVEFIYDTIVLKDRMSYTEIQFKRDLDTITNILKTNGYYFASINSTKKLIVN